jgi:hypothetical protein
MITDAQINAMPEAARHAWIDSVQGDERTILYWPVGRRYTMVFISIVKRHLEQELPIDVRAKLFDWLDTCGAEWLTPEAVAHIEPMCDEGYAIVREAEKLGAGKALDVYARHEVFSAFCALNRTLLSAIELCR